MSLAMCRWCRYLWWLNTNVDRTHWRWRDFHGFAHLRSGGSVAVFVCCCVMGCWLPSDRSLKPLLFHLALLCPLSFLCCHADGLEFLLLLPLSLNLCLRLGLHRDGDSGNEKKQVSAEMSSGRVHMDATNCNIRFMCCKHNVNSSSSSSSRSGSGGKRE